MNAPVIPVPAPDGVLRGRLRHGRVLRRGVRDRAGGEVVPAPHYAEVVAQIASMDGKDVRRAAELANRSFLHRGVTFTIYSDDAPAAERILPFDPIPRIVPADEWAVVEAGLRQRIKALNRFVHDIYHDQEILHDGVVPRRLVVLARHFRREVVGIDVPDDQYLHVVGSDLIRGDDGRWMVLEDNPRTPSGVSYVLVEPPDHDAHVPRLVRRARRALGRLLRGPAARQPRRALAAARRRRASAAGRRSSC